MRGVTRLQVLPGRTAVLQGIDVLQVGCSGSFKGSAQHPDLKWVMWMSRLGPLRGDQRRFWRQIAEGKETV
ncbi:hypothetical protein, partial [Branchiibius sp. NY16-3462-2]|uniref:hypothetical protein n=1 Tax=Branchiibius sp. NY16-3462-2 TaxID=1807500 RepID=UPI0025BE4011